MPIRLRSNANSLNGLWGEDNRKLGMTLLYHHGSRSSQISKYARRPTMLKSVFGRMVNGESNRIHCKIPRTEVDQAQPVDNILAKRAMNCGLQRSPLGRR